MELTKFSSGIPQRPVASVFSIAITCGAIGLTIAEYIPDFKNGSLGFLIGFTVGFVILSFVAFVAFSKPTDPITTREPEEDEATRELIDWMVTVLRSRRGKTEWK